MLILNAVSMLLLWICWPTTRQYHSRSGAVEIASISTCPVPQAVPIPLPSVAWRQNITDESTCLRATDVFDLPRATQLLELDEMIEKYAWYLTTTTTRRYWDIACVLTNIAQCLRKYICTELVQLVARGSDFLRVEESRMKDEIIQLKTFYDQVGVISDAVLRDAQVAQRVQFSGEDDPILLGQNVSAENSLLQWTHLPRRLRPHLARTKDICTAAINSMIEATLPIRDLREYFEKTMHILSATPQTDQGLQDTVNMVRLGTFTTTLQLPGLQATNHLVYSYYLELFGLTNTSTQGTEPSCLLWRVGYA